MGMIEKIKQMRLGRGAFFLSILGIVIATPILWFLLSFGFAVAGLRVVGLVAEIILLLAYVLGIVFLFHLRLQTMGLRPWYLILLIIPIANLVLFIKCLTDPVKKEKAKLDDKSRVIERVIEKPKSFKEIMAGLALATVLALVAVAVYWPSMTKCGFIWDDNLLIYENGLMMSDKAVPYFWWPMPPDIGLGKKDQPKKDQPKNEPTASPAPTDPKNPWDEFIPKIAETKPTAAPPQQKEPEEPKGLWPAPPVARRTPDYYPLTWTTIWLEWHKIVKPREEAIMKDPVKGVKYQQLTEDERLVERARIFHINNVLLHALSCILLWRVLKGMKIPGAYLAALVFAVHPINVASVTWISERKNVLSMILILASVLCWLRFDRSWKAWRWVWYAFAFIAFVLAMISKSSVVFLPMLLLGLAWWLRGRINYKDILHALPFFIIGLVLAKITMDYQAKVAIGGDVIRTDDWVSRTAGAGTALWWYVYKCLAPIRNLMIYPRWNIDAGVTYWGGVMWFIGGSVYVGAIAYMALAALKYKRSWARGPLFWLLFHAA